MRSCCISFIFCVVVGIVLCAVKIKAQNIRGTPGVDYPNYPSIPNTSFKCSEQKYIPGFYADLETDCQVFHFCFDNRHESFLCPTGTTFNQKVLGCDSWYSSNCSLSPQFYAVNVESGIDGDKIPLLLKLRDRAKDGFTTIASVSNLFDKISALNKESPQKDSKEASEERMATVTVDNVKHEATDIGREYGINSEMTEAIKLERPISDTEGDQSAGRLEDNGEESRFNLFDSSYGNLDESRDDLNDESSNQELIYDPVTEGYYMQNDYSSDSEWPSEYEPNSQFQSFYDRGSFEDQMMKDEGKTVKFQDSYEDETYIDEEGNEYSAVQDENDSENSQFVNDMSQSDEMSEFYKRLSQNIKIPKRTRRRPTYFVVDQPEGRVPLRQSLYSVLEPTESPFAEPISIDSVVEESSTEFMEFAAGDSEQFEMEESDKDFVENAYDITKSNKSDFENYFSEDSNRSSSAPSDSEVQQDYDSEASEEEFDKFRESIDRSINNEHDLTEGHLSDSTAENENESVNVVGSEGEDSEEDIIIYDDSEDPEIDDESASNEQDTLIVIPDETDQTLSEDGTMDSSSDNAQYELDDSSDENWQYVYSQTEIPQNAYSEGSRYMYEEREQVADELENGGAYDPSAYAERSNYEYPGTYDEINYQPSYDLPGQEVQNVPESYYQYMPKYQESSEQEPSDVYYQIPDDNQMSEEEDSDSEANPDSSEFDQTDGLPSIPNVPGRFHSYKSSDGQSYGYDYAYPQMQETGYMEDDPYSSQYSYSYGNMEGDTYSNERDENQFNFESDYVTESSDTGLPLAPEYEGLQEAWAQTDFEAENSEVIDEEDSETNDSQEFETEGGYTLSYDELSSEGSNEDFGLPVTEMGYSDNFKDQMQNEETYYVIEDDPDENADSSLNFEMQENTEEIVQKSNETSDVDQRDWVYPDWSSDHQEMSKKGLDKLKPSETVDVPGVVYSDSESMLNIPNGKVKMEGVETSELGIQTDSMSLDKNSNQKQDSWQSLTFGSDQEKENPATLESLAGKMQTNYAPPSRDFMTPSETRILNSMPFPNSMDFGPYGFGSNTRQQFAMMDSSNLAPFSKVENRIETEAVNSDMSRLSKLASLQEKVRSMKGGKFGMFKKYMNSIKNQNA